MLRDTLVRTRELLSVPERWTKGTFARNSTGKAVSTGDRHATCFCLVGAVIKVAREVDDEDAVFDHLEKFTGNGISPFNDDPNTTHDMILKVLDDAIANAD